MSKPKPAKPRQQSTPAATQQPYQKTGGDWVRLEKSKLAFYQIGLNTDRDKARFLDSFTAGLVLGKLGLNALADDCLTEAAAYREQASRAGKRGRQKQLAQSGGPPATPGHPRPDDTNDTNDTNDSDGTHRPKPKPRKPGESVSVWESVCMSLGTQDSPALRQDAIENMPPDELPEWATAFCREDDPQQAVRAFRNQLNRIKPETFREELSAFVAELDAGGEEPDSRGAAFMSRLKKATDGSDL